MQTMKTIAGLSGAVLLLTACATSGPGQGFGSYASEVTLPNGSQGWAISCATTNECLRRADQVCPAGYALLDQRSAQGQSIVAVNEYAALGTSNRDVLIMAQCN